MRFEIKREVMACTLKALMVSSPESAALIFLFHSNPSLYIIMADSFQLTEIHDLFAADCAEMYSRKEAYMILLKLL